MGSMDQVRVTGTDSRTGSRFWAWCESRQESCQGARGSGFCGDVATWVLTVQGSVMQDQDRFRVQGSGF